MLLGNIQETFFFLWFLLGLITAGSKTIKSQNTVLVRGDGEDVSGNGGGWVLKLRLQHRRVGGGRGLSNFRNFVIT